MAIAANLPPSIHVTNFVRSFDAGLMDMSAYSGEHIVFMQYMYKWVLTCHQCFLRLFLGWHFCRCAHHLSSAVHASSKVEARKFFVGGNWKCNGSIQHVSELVEMLNGQFTNEVLLRYSKQDLQSLLWAWLVFLRILMMIFIIYIIIPL